MKKVVGLVAAGATAFSAPAIAAAETTLTPPPPNDSTMVKICSQVLEITQDDSWWETIWAGKSVAPGATSQVCPTGPGGSVVDLWGETFPNYTADKPTVFEMWGFVQAQDAKVAGSYAWRLFGGSAGTASLNGYEKWKLCDALYPEPPAYCASNEAPVTSTTLYVKDQALAVKSKWPVIRTGVAPLQYSAQYWGAYITEIDSAKAGAYTLWIGSDDENWQIGKLEVKEDFGQTDDPDPPETPEEILLDDPTVISDTATPAPVTRDTPVYFSIPASENMTNARGACEWRGNKVACVSETSKAAGFTGLYTLKANLSGTKKMMKGACQWTDIDPQCRVWLTEKGKWRLTWGAGDKSVARTVVVK